MKTKVAFLYRFGSLRLRYQSIVLLHCPLRQPTFWLHKSNTYCHCIYQHDAMKAGRDLNTGDILIGYCLEP